ncbi:MAG: hypothetical protein N2712_00585 [Brevinematales bacterium]|nr:hypothetical protein [Brevinematales bacterium]
MSIYKEISASIEKLIENDQRAKYLYEDMIKKTQEKKLSKETLHPFISYVSEKIRIIHGNIEPKEIKKALIHFYSKNFIGIDVDLWK